MIDNSVFSIIMPAYNSAHFIKESIESVLNQSYIHWELIIVDDGSLDDLEEVVKYFLQDKRIFYIKQMNGGVANARNCGIRKASGDFISFLDSDDLWEKDKLLKTMEVFLRHRNVGLVYSQYFSFSSTPREASLATDYPHFNKSPYESLIVLNYIGTLTVTVRKEVLKKVGFFDEGLFGTEDWDLWIRILKSYDCLQIKYPLAYYRVHSLGISKNKDKHFKEELKTLDKHLLSNTEKGKYKEAAYLTLHLREVIYEFDKKGISFSIRKFFSKLFPVSSFFGIFFFFIRIIISRTRLSNS